MLPPGSLRLPRPFSPCVLGGSKSELRPPPARTAGYGAEGTAAASVHTAGTFFPATLKSPATSPPVLWARGPVSRSQSVLPASSPVFAGAGSGNGDRLVFPSLQKPRGPPSPPSRHLAAVPAHDRDIAAADIPRGMWLSSKLEGVFFEH